MLIRRRGCRDQHGGPPKRGRVDLTLAITPNVDNSDAQFLAVSTAYSVARFVIIQTRQGIHLRSNSFELV